MFSSKTKVGFLIKINWIISSSVCKKHNTESEWDGKKNALYVSATVFCECWRKHNRVEWDGRILSLIVKACHSLCIKSFQIVLRNLPRIIFLKTQFTIQRAEGHKVFMSTTFILIWISTKIFLSKLFCVSPFLVRRRIEWNYDYKFPRDNHKHFYEETV